MCQGLCSRMVLREKCECAVMIIRLLDGFVIV